MLEYLSPRWCAVMAPLTYKEIKTLSEDEVLWTFNENERHLIEYAEKDPALRSFLDRKFDLGDAPPLAILITVDEEYEKFSPSERAALDMASKHRRLLHAYVSVVLGVLEKLPPLPSSVH